MSNPARRRAFTLVELVLVCVLLALLSAVALRPLGRELDRIAARDAVRAAALAIAQARGDALARRAIVAVRIDTVAGTVALRTGGRTLRVLALGHTYGVTLSTTRDSIAFDVRGLGYGAANLTLVARRGGAADTLVVSRLGRTRS